MHTLSTLPAEVRLNIYDKYVKLTQMDMGVIARPVPTSSWRRGPARYAWQVRFLLSNSASKTTVGLPGVSKLIREEFIAFVCDKNPLRLLDFTDDVPYPRDVDPFICLHPDWKAALKQINIRDEMWFSLLPADIHLQLPALETIMLPEDHGLERYSKTFPNPFTKTAFYEADQADVVKTLCINIFKDYLHVSPFHTDKPVPVNIVQTLFVGTYFLAKVRSFTADGQIIVDNATSSAASGANGASAGGGDADGDQDGEDQGDGGEFEEGQGNAAAPDENDHVEGEDENLDAGNNTDTTNTPSDGLHTSIDDTATSTCACCDPDDWLQQEGAIMRCTLILPAGQKASSVRFYLEWSPIYEESEAMYLAAEEDTYLWSVTIPEWDIEWD